MRHVFLMDPVEDLDIDKDTTFVLMLEAQRRGHELLYATDAELYQRRGRAAARVRPVALQRVRGDHVRLGEARELPLGDADVVWMRKDPPFDMDYVASTWLLDLAARETLVCNHPAGLRTINEKAWCMRFPELVPESLITQSEARLNEFVDELGETVVKPLDLAGGESVFLLRRDDPNRGVIVEAVTRHGRRKVLAQRYIPEAREGDKRILLIEGEPVAACLRRPSGVDHRGNIHAGASVERTVLTDRDRQICDVLGPELRAEGQIFTGIDVLGGCLTEVNVTSPTCVQEVDALEGISVEGMVLDAVEARAA